jgi:hypothetical protein
VSTITLFFMTEMVDTGVPVWVLLAAKAVRACIAITAFCMTRPFGQPTRHASLVAPRCVVIVVLVVSGAVLIGQMLNLMLIMIRGLGSHVAAEEGLDQIMTRWMVALVDTVLSFLWLRCVPNTPGAFPGTPSAPRRHPWKDGGRDPPMLPVTSFEVRVGSERRDLVCSICLDELSPGCLAGRLPCEHVYHDGCIRRWLESGHGRVRCPMRCSVTPSSSHDAGHFGGVTLTNGEAMDLEGGLPTLNESHLWSEAAVAGRSMGLDRSELPGPTPSRGPL